MIGKRTPVYSDLVLIRDGKAEASIVLASEADPKARAAADDLQNILHTMTVSSEEFSSFGGLAASVEETSVLCEWSRVIRK